MNIYAHFLDFQDLLRWLGFYTFLGFCRKVQVFQNALLLDLPHCQAAMRVAAPKRKQIYLLWQD